MINNVFDGLEEEQSKVIKNWNIIPQCKWSVAFVEFHMDLPIPGH